MGSHVQTGAPVGPRQPNSSPINAYSGYAEDTSRYRNCSVSLSTAVTRLWSALYSNLALPHCSSARVPACTTRRLTSSISASSVAIQVPSTCGCQNEPRFKGAIINMINIMVSNALNVHDVHNGYLLRRYSLGAIINMINKMH